MHHVRMAIRGFSLLIALTACKDQSSVSKVKIDNGQVISSKSKNKVPAVVYISNALGGGQAAACTATAVSDTTLITAGHCIGRSGDSTGKLQSNLTVGSGAASGAKASAVFATPGWIRNGDSQSDMAVAIFPAGTFKNYMEVSAAPMQRGQEFIMIGYSTVNLPDPSEGSKRWGRNVAAEVDGLIVAYRTGSADGNITQGGDSGSPVITSDCKVRGVLHGTQSQPNDPNKDSMYATATLNQQWLVSMQSVGAHICGLQGVDASHCAPEGISSPLATSDKTEFPCSESALGGQPNPQPSTSPTPTSAPDPGGIFVSMASDLAKPGFLISVPFADPVVAVCKGSDAAACTASQFALQPEANVGVRAVVKTTDALTLETASKETMFVITAKDKAGGQALVQKVRVTSK